MSRRWLLIVGCCVLGVVCVPALAGKRAVALPPAPAAEAPAAPLRNAEVGPQLRALVEADWIDRDRLFAAPKPAAGKAEQAAGEVTTVEDAAGGCDGIKTGRWGFHSASGETDPWWQVDLGQVYPLDRVVVFNRTDGKSINNARKLRILVGQEAHPKDFQLVYEHDGSVFYGVLEKKPLVVKLRDQHVSARIVRLQVPGKCSFGLDEIEVYAADDPQKNIALGRPADQKSVGKYSTRNHAAGAAVASVPAAASFTLTHTREVVGRAQQLAARLRSAADAARLGRLVADLAKLDERLAGLERQPNVPDDARRDIYYEACRLSRAIAFCNPLLSGIDRLLFIKRHDAVGVFHMCDQFYGCNARPGGSLFVLDDPFGAHPRLTDLLADAVVERGRMKGRKLCGGSLLSPELSFDGRTILFAYTEAKAFAQSHGKETYLWGPEYSYHLFQINSDGTGLVQLTDGDCDDFDPCWLPNGRIAFVSERRGGYLRCGRHCPTYTLFSMAADGSDIICLSFHETHEWQPSVDHNGMIVYTRWDYVDRDSDIAHHLWTCFPDGRDPRSLHGNYPRQREDRPFMEQDIRAIPGSQKYVATAGAHHGHALGSLVLVDLRVRDDAACSQVIRLTPDVPFPESEGGKKNIAQQMVYGTAWPLSEDDYLCVYDSQAKDHGVYWIDRSGNKELLYRDPAIACFSPIPLRPRPRPPILPDRTTQAAAGPSQAPCTMAVMNVYNADFAWPKDTRIRALRLIQALPKSTPPPDQPRIGAARQSNARAVLGTVPVEADGSAYFQAPPGKAIYFQALDERGLAVQSMRSATYLHPGEQLVCQGCHEPKHQPAPLAGATPLALRREPSPIRPEAEGSNPFSYVRLVQPVLDRNCVACHQQKKALDLSGPLEGKFGWSRSYANLAAKYGFYFDVYNGSIKDPVHGGSRTVAGQFGARAAPLWKYLGAEHYGVRLSEADFHRLTLWLDCNSEFYGSYENIQAQARGEVVPPTLE